MLYRSKSAAMTCLLVLSSCAVVPTGPSVLILPGTGKNFEQFRADDFSCRQYASTLTGGRTPSRAAAAGGLTSAAIGTGLGAAAGAAIGGGEGAAIGAGTGLAAGGLVGTGTASTSAGTAQERYDIGYIQCMYAKGNRVPVPGRFSYEDRQGARPTVTPPNPIPPPPPEPAQ
jgi:hypothetical protein